MVIETGALKEVESVSREWKILKKGGVFFEVQKNVIEGNFRIIITNSKKIFSEISEEMGYKIAEDEDKVKITKEFEELKIHILPILKRFDEEKMTLKKKQLSGLLEGVQKKLSTKDKPKLKLSQKKTKSYTFEENSESEESDVDLSSDESDEEDSDEEDEEYKPQNKIKNIKDLQNCIEKVLREYSTLNSSMGRFQRMKKKNPRGVDNIATLTNIENTKESLQRSTKQLENFFYMNKRNDSKFGQQNAQLMRKLKQDFKKIENKSKVILSSDQSKEIKSLYLKKKIAEKKARDKRRSEKKRNSTYNSDLLEDDSDMEEEQNYGQQRSKQQQKYKISQKTKEQIELEKALAKEAQDELLDISTQTNELLDMMKDMNTLVDEDTQRIEDIESTIETAEIHMQKGRKHINSSRKKQKLGLNKVILGGIKRIF